jgi:hypothetical protein|uniref:Uncharacterized protein n=1 Tax=viral metagenome TaxID=1070528 RepID=A0A6C0D8H1_9ZZZZ
MHSIYRTYITKNVTLVSVLLFLVIFITIQIGKPSFLYKEDGSIRDFGIGYRNKTILPVWLLAIVLGVLSYLFVLYYISNQSIF